MGAGERGPGPGLRGLAQAAEVGGVVLGRAAAVVKHVVTLPWNDPDACEKILDKQGSDIAALIIDPLLANAGLIPVREDFLEKLREVTQRLGILLIFDEVISFRIGRGGAQERFNIRLDLTTLGKIIGGGLAVGAFGGRADGDETSRPARRQGPDQPRGHLQRQPAASPPWSSSPRRPTRALDALGDRLRDGVRRLLRKKGYVRLALLAAPQQEDSATTAPRGPRIRRCRAHLPRPGQRGRAPLPGLGACSLAMTDADVEHRFVETLRASRASSSRRRGGADIRNEVRVMTKNIDLNCDMGESWRLDAPGRRGDHAVHQLRPQRGLRLPRRRPAHHAEDVELALAPRGGPGRPPLAVSWGSAAARWTSASASCRTTSATRRRCARWPARRGRSRST